MRQEIQDGLTAALLLLADLHEIDSKNIKLPVHLERCKDSKKGDWASNIAMQYARTFGKSPMELADELVVSVPIIPSIASMEVVAPGFINIRLSRESELNVLSEIVNKSCNFGCSTQKNNQKVLVEFVSANPTGPLHVGHGRGAAFGDALVRVLRANGYQVEAEYYVNDAGRQMDILALSVYWRYLQLHNDQIEFPQGLYQGDYVIDIAKKIPNKSELIVNPSDWNIEEENQDIFIDKAILQMKNHLASDYQLFFQTALDHELNDIKEDLAEFGVEFDNWFSERSLLQSDFLQETIDYLDKNQLIYIKDGATWFKSSKFGDEKDRVLIRENGQKTYFAHDIAYHADKYRRGYDRMIDIFGADHHGYLSRIKASMEGLEVDDSNLLILLVQFAVLYKGGEKVQMSTRSGQFVTLRQLRNQIGNDAARFFYAMRKPEQHLDFDLDLAQAQTRDNPFYYVEYAHARCCSVLKRLENFSAKESLVHKNQLTNLKEREILRILGKYQETVEQAGETLSVHLIINYLKDLASALHHYYDSGMKILDDDHQVRSARLLLIDCVRQVLANGLRLIGVRPLEKM